MPLAREDPPYPTASPFAGGTRSFHCQTRVRHDDRREYTKHMLRLRPGTEITGEDVNEIILLVRREVAY